MGDVHIHTTLERNGPATHIELTDAQVADLGGGKTAPVKVIIAGRTSRLRLARMGGQNVIGLSKAARAELGVGIGDEVDAVVVLDTEERPVEIPAALAKALAADPSAKAAFDALAPSKRKEMGRQIAEAKTDATRDRRLEKLLDQLS